MGYYKKLPERQHAVMETWKNDYSEFGAYYIYTFYGIAMRALKIKKPSETQVKRVRKTVRLLARKEYLKISQRLALLLAIIIGILAWAGALEKLLGLMN